MKTGQLGKQDYIRERQEANGLKIEPFNQTVDLKLASYDITPTMIAMSTKLGMLETVYQAKDTSLYIKVRAKDTVLVVSNEYFSVPPDMAGYVMSRVSKVADGFGHVSTSIDPNWKGALLIALSNPTNKAIKIGVGRDRGPNTRGDSLATVSFHYLHAPVTEEARPDPNFEGMRLDLLQSKRYSARPGIKAILNRFLHFRRRRFTDDFFKYVTDEIITLESWPEVSKVLNGLGSADRPNPFAQYIVKENWLTVLLGWARKHWVFVLALMFVVLYALGIIPEELESWVVDKLKKLKEFRDLIPVP